jgi:formylglycine-generating enzyme required for sulfatase activity
MKRNVIILILLSTSFYIADVNHDITAANSINQPLQTINGINFVSLPGGAFQMGDEKGDLEDFCKPVHQVSVASFQMSETEITNSQYCAYLNGALASAGFPHGGIFLEKRDEKYATQRVRLKK